MQVDQTVLRWTVETRCRWPRARRLVSILHGAAEVLVNFSDLLFEVGGVQGGADDVAFDGVAHRMFTVVTQGN